MLYNTKASLVNAENVVNDPKKPIAKKLSSYLDQCVTFLDESTGKNVVEKSIEKLIY